MTIRLEMTQKSEDIGLDIGVYHTYSDDTTWMNILEGFVQSIQALGFYLSKDKLHSAVDNLDCLE